MSTPRRVADALCRKHLTATLTDHWPFPGDLRAAIESCSACTIIIYSLREGDGAPWVRTFIDLTVDEFTHQTATHEAAHVIAGILSGHRLDHVELAADGTFGNGTDDPSGHVTWAPWEMPIIDHLTMVWAGEASGVRWIREHGHDTEADLVDIRYLSCGDVAEAEEWAGRLSIPVATGRAEAAVVVEQHWSTIQVLADRLIERRRLTAADVDRLVAGEIQVRVK